MARRVANLPSSIRQAVVSPHVTGACGIPCIPTEQHTLQLRPAAEGWHACRMLSCSAVMPIACRPSFKTAAVKCAPGTLFRR